MNEARIVFTLCSN